MTEHESKGMYDAKDRIIIPIKVGLLVGSVAIGLPYIINFIVEQHFWNLVIGYNYTFHTTLSFLYIALFSIGSLFVGGESCRRLGAAIRNENDAFKAGIISGTASYFLLIGLMIGTKLIFSKTSFAAMGIIPSTNIFDILFHVVIFMISLSASVIIQSVGSISYFSYKTRSDKSIFNGVDSRPGTLIIKHLNCILALLILLIIFVPFGVVYYEMRMDLIEPMNVDCCGLFPNSVSANRLGTDSIVIGIGIREGNVEYGMKNPFVDSVPGLEKPRIIVHYNSKDLSDQLTIDRQGLSDRIDPPEGLRYISGSRVILNGSDISNVTAKGNLEIIDVNPSRGTRLMNMTLWNGTI
jgi:hypothetical protein